MKYGPIICDPTSEEAKALVGKKVVASDSYIEISNPDDLNMRTLVEVTCACSDPFRFVEDVHYIGYTFIREVIEETPKYRPYEDTDEMVKDFNERFSEDIFTSSMEMPRIWVTFPNGPKEIVSAFGKNTVWLNGDCFMLDYIFETGYTYLDGSPVGKEVNG